MLVRIYWSMWTIVALGAVILFALGSFTMLTTVVFGFFAFGLVFMGMMSVLPGTVAHPAGSKSVNPESKATEPARQPAVDGFQILKSA